MTYHRFLFLKVGTFVFRIYDASDPVNTLATSHAWQVDAQGKDVELSVRFVLNQLCNADGKGSVMGALAQLAHLLGHVQARYATALFSFCSIWFDLVLFCWGLVTHNNGISRTFFVPYQPPPPRPFYSPIALVSPPFVVP